MGGTIFGSWYPATPPAGTGVHHYVAYRGVAPCPATGHCAGCAAPAGEILCSVQINSEDCSVVSGPETRGRPEGEPAVRIFGAKASKDGVERVKDTLDDTVRVVVIGPFGKSGK